MPLPEGTDIPWPPKDIEPIYTQIATWAAWYSGDMEALHSVYAGVSGSKDTHGVFASEGGGFRAAVSKALDSIRRWFWGQRVYGNQQRNRLHVPLAGDIATASADLLFSEPPSVTVPPTVREGEDGNPTEVVDEATQSRLDELMDDGMHATLLEAAEISAALGGVFLRIVWDDTQRDRPWITAVHPDAAVPEWRWGDLAAVTFWRVIARKGKLVVRHLERHEPGRILHGVYEGDEDTLGNIASLADYPDTAGLVEQLENGNEIPTGAPDRLTAVYIPNMRPNRIWRNTPGAACLGRSDYSGVEPLMDALDMTYSSWMRDVELGKARLIVPQEYLRSNGVGAGASVDLDREVYEGLNLMGREDGQVEIKEVQFAIRVDEHSRTCDDLKSTIVTTAGYSPQTFGIGDAVAMTATEVAAKQRRSFITRDRKIRYFRPKLGDLYETWLLVDRDKFGSQVTPVRPQIEWADAVSVDPEAQARELELLHRAEAISTEEKVRRQHPDWGDDEVDDEVKKIHERFQVENPDEFERPDDPGEGEVEQVGG